MSTQVSVEGEDITPDDFQDTGWSVATAKRKLRATRTPRNEMQASVSMPGCARSFYHCGAKVKRRLIAASRLPHLPRDNHRVIVSPRNGLDMRHVSQIKFAKSLAMAVALSERDVAEDEVCPNMMQNIAVISPLAEKNANARERLMEYTSAFAEQDADIISFTDGGSAPWNGNFLLVVAAGGSRPQRCRGHLRRVVAAGGLRRYHPAQVAAAPLRARATSCNHQEEVPVPGGAPVPEAEQVAVRDPGAVPTLGCLLSASVCSRDQHRTWAFKIKSSQRQGQEHWGTWSLKMGDQNPAQLSGGAGRSHHGAPDVSARFGPNVVQIDASDGSFTEDMASYSDFTVVSSRRLRRKIRRTSPTGRQAPKKASSMRSFTISYVPTTTTYI
ncbi:hypothetical protein HPB52_004547 [Rhipicephalus sanguineus]|uniref:Uncharacterized protein n=1 Tax=Rhipicephalus sanguineus TaxID=34632 RepID=A0A9D4SVM0_RHISA|nr:hypothetical protein HPB52_004547 [Rhipicephalus sanguineus]